MGFVKSTIGLTVMQWALGVVILIEAILFVIPSAAHDFARLPMPGFVRMLLGWGEILGCILLLIPRTSARGAWLLLAVFVMAILIHLLRRHVRHWQPGHLCRRGLCGCVGENLGAPANGGCLQIVV